MAICGSSFTWMKVPLIKAKEKARSFAGVRVICLERRRKLEVMLESEFAHLKRQGKCGVRWSPNLLTWRDKESAVCVRVRICPLRETEKAQYCAGVRFYPLSVRVFTGRW